MRRKLVIEMVVYAIIVVIGVILLFTYKPKDREIVIPKDFDILWEGGDGDAALFNE